MSTTEDLSRTRSYYNTSKEGQNSFIGVESRFRRQNHFKFWIILLSLSTALAFGLSLSIYYGHNENPVCKTKYCIRAASNLLQSMDFRVNPCDDFYQFTCGNWAEEHPKPDSASSFDWFSERQMKVLRKIRKFLSSNRTANEPETIDQTRIMYQACMDTAQMDSIGLQPVIDHLRIFSLPEFPSIINIQNDSVGGSKDFDWIYTIAEIKRIIGLDIIFGFDVLPDPTNRTQKRIVFGTPEMNSVLPFKTTYEKRLKRLMNKHIQQNYQFIPRNDDSLGIPLELKVKSEDTVKIYTSYMTEIISAFVFVSEPNVQIALLLPAIKDTAIKIIKMTKFFIELADEAENVTERDTNYVTNDLLNVNINDFQNLSNKLIVPKVFRIWQQYLETIFKEIDPKFEVSEQMILSSWSDIYYIQHAILYILDTPPEELELYIWWTVVEEFVLHTISDFRQLHNEYARTITDLEGTTPRSFYCTSIVNQLMGMAVSYAIVQPDFSITTKPEVSKMIQNIRHAFDNLVREATWMDAETKCSTLEKSRAMKSFVGFPEWILKPGELDKFYGKLNLMNKTTHLKNLINVIYWQMSNKLRALNVIENIEWATTPTNVNAFHTFQANTITVPLAILQYPFYNLGLESLNYGVLGTILGHEITHGFDNSGRQFDKDGNMRQWWTNKTIAEYINRTECFIKQYNSYYLSDVNNHIDGKLTLGENIADNGGLREAFYAYKLYVEKNGNEKMLPGFEKFTHEQLLFISFGNLWCETQTPNAIKLALQDTHCPGRVRLQGVLDNSNEFIDVFGCHSSSNIHKNQCRIW